MWKFLKRAWNDGNEPNEDDYMKYHEILFLWLLPERKIYLDPFTSKERTRKYITMHDFTFHETPQLLQVFALSSCSIFI